MSGIDALLASLPPWTLVGGKGGVGKTTCAAALALHSARGGTPTLALSTDPAGTLADALGTALVGEPRHVATTPSLWAFQLDATSARTDFLARSGDVLATILDRGTYLDREDIRGLVDATLPGIDETMAVLALADLAGRSDWQRVVLDTAPTGHTLRLLALPDAFRSLVELLDAMQAKHRFMVSALTHRYRPDEADAFIRELRTKLDRLESLMSDPRRAAAVLVARPEAVVIAETVRYAAALAEMRVTVRAVVLNVVPDPPGNAMRSSIEAVSQAVPGATLFAVPDSGVLGPGPSALDRWADGVRQLAGRGRQPRRTNSRTPSAGASARDVRALPEATGVVDSIPPVAIVGGKGGVGKTTAAAALALASARAGRRTLLVSTDPAPSIADALRQPISDIECEVRDGFGLVARQIDATAAFSRWRAEYEARVDTAFDALLGPGLDAAHDRAIARQLFSLAPPGIDELYALIWLGDAVTDGTFERIVVDPAPTGHLIRLLEMPALALDWAHRLLRLMLKYRELAGGGELAGELVSFSRRTRAVAALLHDEARAGVIVVALDEPIVRTEAARIVERVRTLGNHVPALIWNRASVVPTPLPTEPRVRQFVAGATLPPPVEAPRLLQWFDDWRTLRLDA